MALNCKALTEEILPVAEKKLNQLREKLFDAKKVELDNDDISFLKSTAEKIMKMDDGDAKDLEIARMMARINDKIPATAGEIAKAVQRVSLLGNAKTMMRNVIGNVFFGGAEIASQPLARVFDAGVRRLGGVTQKSVGKSSVETIKSSFKKGYNSAWTDFAERIDTVGGIHKFEAKAGKLLKENGFIDIDKPENFKELLKLKEVKDVFNVSNFEKGKKVKDLIDWSSKESIKKSFKALPEDARLAYSFNRLNETVSFGLKLGDSPFKRAYLDDTIQSLISANNLKEATPEILEIAKMVTLQRTFQEVNTLTKAFNQGRTALRFGKDFGIGDFVLPFTTTPANIMQRIIDYSPAGIVKVFKNSIKFKNNKSLLNQRELVDSLTRMTTGTGLIAAGYTLAKEGLINPGISKDKDINKLRKQMGIQPYSFNVGGVNVTYDWSQPLSTLIAIGSDMYNEGKDEDSMFKATYNAMQSGGSTLTDQTLLSGVNKLFGGENILDGVLDVAKNIPAQFVPTLLSQLARTVDPTERDYYDPNKAKGLLAPVKARIPFLRQTLSPQVGSLGEEISSGGFMMKALVNFLVPANVKNINSSGVQDEIFRLYDEKLGRTSHLPRVVSNKLSGYDPKTKKEVKFDLTKEEKVKLQKVTGKLTHKVYDRAINGLTYKNLSDDKKYEYLKSLLSDVKKQAELKILEGRKYIKK